MVINFFMFFELKLYSGCFWFGFCVLPSNTDGCFWLWRIYSHSFYTGGLFFILNICSWCLVEFVIFYESVLWRLIASCSFFRACTINLSTWYWNTPSCFDLVVVFFCLRTISNFFFTWLWFSCIVKIYTKLFMAKPGTLTDFEWFGWRSCSGMGGISNHFVLWCAVLRTLEQLREAHWTPPVGGWSTSVSVSLKRVSPHTLLVGIVKWWVGCTPVGGASFGMGRKELRLAAVRLATSSLFPHSEIIHPSIYIQEQNTCEKFNTEILEK